MITFPNAKINLGLHVLNKRDDGYHNILSLLYPVGLTDVLEVIESGKFSFSSSGLSIPGDEHENLVVKAFRLLKKDFGLPEVSIHLHKNIPTGAGLGGGSSDGSFMLKMLNILFELFLDDSILEDYAMQLGSDCPFFIRNAPSIVSGKGDQLEDFPLDLKGYFIFLVKPDRAISTRDAFRLIHPGDPDMDIRKILHEKPVGAWREFLKNDFERSFFEILPDLREIKDKLYDAGAVYASMTGSGSAFYGIFKEERDMKGIFPGSWFTWEGAL